MSNGQKEATHDQRNQQDTCGKINKDRRIGRRRTIIEKEERSANCQAGQSYDRNTKPSRKTFSHAGNSPSWPSLTPCPQGFGYSKLMVRRANGDVICRQYNPGAEIRFGGNAVMRVSPALTMAEVLGA